MFPLCGGASQGTGVFVGSPRAPELCPRPAQPGGRDVINRCQMWLALPLISKAGEISVCALQSWILLSRALGKVFPSQEIAFMFIFVLNENDDLNISLFFCMTFFFP